MPTITTCHFCKSAAESCTKDRKFAVCRKCAEEILAPLFAEAIGPKEAIQRVLDNLARKKAKAGAAGEDKLDKLIAGRPPMQFSRGLGTPARPAAKPARAARRPAVSVATQRLILARAQARSEGQVYEGDVAGMVAKAGLKTYGATELSTATAGAGTAATTRTPTRPAGKKAPPSKADIRAICEKAGLGVA
jgi:hypothetical protein